MRGTAPLLCLTVGACGVAAPSPAAPGHIAAYHAAMLRGELSAVELLTESLARIVEYEAVEPRGMAITTLVTAAHQDAEAADLHLAVHGRLLGPLHGIPVVVKDNIDVAGTPTSLGLRALADATAPGDATCIARLRRAGAVIVAKTNLATLARSSRDSVSELSGRTRNPAAPECTIGGSSGGSAAAVSADLVVAAIGTDTGASIRGPAAHAGVVGFRPTFGKVPMSGVAPLYVSRDTVGSFTRTVSDAAIVLGVLAEDGELLRAGASLPPQRLTVRIGVLDDLAAPANSDPEVAEHFAAAQTSLRELGAELVPIRGLFDPAALTHIPVDVGRFVADLDTFLRTRRPPYDGLRAADLVPARQVGGHAVAFDAVAAAARTGALRENFAALWRRHELAAVVYPAWSRAPLPLTAGRQANGDNSGYLVPPLGLPAIVVPMGRTADGRPTGIEFATMPSGDAELVAIAAAFEAVHRGPVGVVPKQTVPDR